MHALFADAAARTLRGLLLPFGELSRPSISTAEPVMFAAGTVAIPADVSALNANRDHNRFTPIARFTSATETPAGIVAEFAVAATPDGDKLLTEASNADLAKRPRLSAEITGLVRNGARAVAAALTGAAFVPAGAFASAALFALAEGEVEGVEGSIVLDPEDGHLDVDVTDLPDDITVTTPDGTTATYTPTPTEAPEGAEFMSKPATPPALIPPTLAPPAPAAPAFGEAALFAALTNPRDNADALHNAGLGALFAIAPVNHSGPTTVTIGADTQVPQALGELWDKRAYARRYVDLFTAGGLTSMKARGWRWAAGKTPEVGDYAGNGAEVPSNALDTEEVTTDAQRLAGGHKLDRRYLDFGDTSVIESYFRHMTEDYARKSDAKALASAVTGATALTATAGPSGIARGLVAIVDGALAVLDSENAPAFAVVHPALWRDIVLSPKDDVLAFLNASLDLEEGALAGFKIRPGAVGVGKALVGAKEGMTFYELPGAPIRIEGADPHHGAVDPALFGYWAAIVNNAKALQLVTAPAA